MNRKKAILYFFIFWFIPFFLVAQNSGLENNQKEEVIQLNKNKQIKFGLKTGFNSSIYLISDFRIDGIKIKQTQNNYKIGYHITPFMRVYLNKKHFIQPELSYQIYRSELSFDKTQKNPELVPSYSTINSELHNFELPILYGFNFISKNPYGMAFFVGPKVKYIWEKKSKITFNNFDLSELDEKIKPFNLGLVLGVGVNISQLFFDFRYEQSFFNLSKEISYNPQTENKKTGKTVFDRRDSVISFSVGVLF